MSEEPNRPFSNFDLKANADGKMPQTVKFAFEFPELLDAFLNIDSKANFARDMNRKLGILAILMVLVALLIASTDMALGSILPEATGILAAVLGLAGAAIMLIGFHPLSPRRTWIRNRLLTESLRLFHFHYIAARIPDIANASGRADREAAYLAHRQATFDQFRARLIDLPRADLDEVVAAPDMVMLDDLVAASRSEISPDDKAAKQALIDVFDVWKMLRLNWQLKYCKEKLAKVSGTRAPTAWQMEHRFSMVAWVCVFVIIALHALHLIYKYLPHIQLVGGFMLHHANLISPWQVNQGLQIAVVWTALISLAVRAMESGLQPQREVERYEQYRSKINVSAVRFDRSQDFATKLEISRGFESQSLEEMQMFVRTHTNSHFLL
ncbi:MAG TPA: hypothetical protein VGG48_13565 [Rhizomicrobium sp.]